MELTERQRVERAFYDAFYEQLNESTPDRDLMVDPSRPPIYFAGMDRIVGMAIAGLGELSGRRILAVGCGHGRAETWLGLHGATVWALDISETAVRMAERVARLNGVAGRVRTVAMPAEQVARRFEPALFDLAYGTEVLHHLDLQRFGPALGQVLVAGGRAAFIEPVALQPLLQAARTSRAVRRVLPVFSHTPTESILTRASLQELARTFVVEHHDFAAITFLIGVAWRYRRLGSAMYALAGLRGAPAAAASEAFAAKVFRLDERLVQSVPAARVLCRKSVLLLRKKGPGAPKCWSP